MRASSVQPAWQIYADQLIMLGHGIALWEPAPLDNYDRVHIGDVGYIRKGHFHLLFRAGIPLGNRVTGAEVPDDFVPLDAGFTFKGQARLPGPLHTTNVKMAGVDVGGSAEHGFLGLGANFQFESTSKDGAILITKQKTFSEDAQLEGNFEKYLLQHHQSWLNYANQKGHGISLKDIVVVTGHDMTLEFAMAAFTENSGTLNIGFEAGASASASASASFWGEWRTEMSVHRNCGPQPQGPPSAPQDSPAETDAEAPSLQYNQCVFIRSFRIRKRAGLFPTVLKAAAGPHDPGSGHRFDEEGPAVEAHAESSDNEFVAIADTPTFIDPLDDFFEYIFKNKPEASVVIVHDSDLRALLDIDLPHADESLQCFLTRLAPQISVLHGVARLCLKGADAYTSALDDTATPSSTHKNISDIPNYLGSSSNAFPTEVLSWTSQDPRESQLFNSWGVIYRFQTDIDQRGQSVTTLWRVMRANREDRVAKLEWAPDGRLGRAVIGKNTMSMADLVRPDPRIHGRRTFNGPDGIQYAWRPSGNSLDINLEDYNGRTISFFRPIKPMRYHNGDVYCELHIPKSNSELPLLNIIVVTAMLYRFCSSFGL